MINTIHCSNDDICINTMCILLLIVSGLRYHFSFICITYISLKLAVVCTNAHAHCTPFPESAILILLDYLIMNNY